MKNREVIEFYENKNSHYVLSDEFVKEYPLIDGYNTRTGQNVDHNNMKLFLDGKY